MRVDDGWQAAKMGPIKLASSEDAGQKRSDEASLMPWKGGSNEEDVRD